VGRERYSRRPTLCYARDEAPGPPVYLAKGFALDIPVRQTIKKGLEQNENKILVTSSITV